MKIILFIFIVSNLICTKLFAQFEMNSSFNPVPGNEEKILPVDAIGLLPGKFGENVVWDFSKISSSDDPTVTVYTISSLTPYYKDFPSSNVASYTSNGQYYNYYKVSKDSFGSLGNGQKLGVVKYSDAQILMQYPMSYGKYFTSNFKGSGSYNEYKLNSSGTFTVTCDAYGTIFLPSGKSDVIRLKLVGIVYDTIYANNDVMSTSFFTSITYSWYKKDYRFPIFYIDESSSGREPVRSAGFVKNSVAIDNSQLKTETY